MDKKLYAHCLSEQIGNIEDRFLREAQETDCAGKLKRQTKWKHAGRLALAACLVLAVCLSAILPQLTGEHTLGDVDMPEWFRASYADRTLIDSLDKLNYYGALLAASNDAVTMGHRTGGSRTARLSAVPAADLLSRVRLSRETETGEGITYFAVDPEEIFTVTKVIAFQIDLNNADNATGFLASQIGEGIADVIVTENSLETMITFRHGERYFSCLLNGYSVDEGGYSATDGKYEERNAVRYCFSTHKYIEGFRIVKNTEQLNFSFYFRMDADTGEITDFLCTHSGDGTASGGTLLSPDTATVVPGSSFLSYLTGSFTVAELEAQFGPEE